VLDHFHTFGRFIGIIKDTSPSALLNVRAHIYPQQNVNKPL
jgi:hypothetical protein